MRNIIDSYNIDIIAGHGHVIKQIRQALDDTSRWYSWTLHKTDDKHYRLTYHVSQTDRYNTVDVGCAVTNIANSIATTTRQRGIIGYEQPTLAVLVEVMVPLINALVNREARRWRQFSHDDLTQTCYLCLCELYRKGYYVHKALLRRTFTNTLYYRLRKMPRDVTMVSLTAPLHDSDDLLTMQDTIPDIAEEQERADKEDAEAMAQVLTAQRELIVGLIGQRRYDDLLREFRSKTVTNGTSSTVRRLRKMLADAGYDTSSWQKYFGG